MYSDQLSTFFADNASNADPKVRSDESMRYEALRLGSFSSYPMDAKGWPSALARQGFYYDEVRDEISCFSCKGKLGHLEGFENGFDQHSLLNPHCQLVLGKDKRNVAMDPQPGSISWFGDTPSTLTTPPTASAADTTDRQSGASSHTKSRTSLKDGPKHEGVSHVALSDQDRSTLMKREKVRFLTYLDWPRDSPVQPQYLAAGGFYFVGPYDRVKCAFCNNVLRNWVAGDDPMEEHKKYYPQCPFVQGARLKGQNVGNIPVENDAEPVDAAATALAQKPTPAQQASALGIITDRPRHPQYAIECNRLKTFTGFPPESPVTPAVLAKAGFFYTGSGDCVRCFYCDMGLRHWEPGDEPWEEHARWYPRCSYIISVKGQSYIQQIQKKYCREFREAVAVTDLTPAVTHGRSLSSDTVHVVGGSPSNSNSGSLSAWLSQQMSTEATRTILEMGYSRALVSAVLEKRYISHGIGFSDVPNLLEAIFEIEESGEDVFIGASYSPGTDEAQRGQQSSDKVEAVDLPGSKAQSGSDVNARVPGDALRSLGKGANVEERSLVEENRLLKEQRICKVCMDGEANIVFLPCGHLCCCSSCSPALRNCPICRQLIRGTVRTFLS